MIASIRFVTSFTLLWIRVPTDRKKKVTNESKDAERLPAYTSMRRDLSMSGPIVEMSGVSKTDSIQESSNSNHRILSTSNQDSWLHLIILTQEHNYPLPRPKAIRLDPDRAS